MALPKHEEGPHSNQDVRLTKLVPKTGKSQGAFDNMTRVQSAKLDGFKKLGEDAPKQKNVLQRIQNFFNKD